MRLPLSLREVRTPEVPGDADVLGIARTPPETIPLGEVAELRYVMGPNQISRENGKRRILVTANVRDRDLGGFVAELQRAVRAEVELPDGYWINYGGTFEQLITAERRFRLVVPATLLIIFVLLFTAFNSIQRCVLDICLRAARTNRRRCRSRASRHPAVHLGNGRFHRTVGRGDLKWYRDGVIHPPPARRR